MEMCSFKKKICFSSSSLNKIYNLKRLVFEAYFDIQVYSFLDGDNFRKMMLFFDGMTVLENGKLKIC